MKVFEHADTLCCMRQLAVVREAVLEAIFIVIRLALAQAPRNQRPRADRRTCTIISRFGSQSRTPSRRPLSGKSGLESDLCTGARTSAGARPRARPRRALVTGNGRSGLPAPRFTPCLRAAPGACVCAARITCGSTQRLASSGWLCRSPPASTLREAQMGMLREAPQRAGSAAHRSTMASLPSGTIRTAISACQMSSEVPQPRATSCLPPNRIGAVGAGGAESSFDARRAAPLLLAQVAAPHALQRLRHGCTGCASLSSVCQRNGCAKLVMRC